MHLSILHVGILRDFSFLFKSILFSWFTIQTFPCLRRKYFQNTVNLLHLLYFISRTAPLCTCLELSCSLIPQRGCSFQLAQKTRCKIFNTHLICSQSFNYLKGYSPLKCVKCDSPALIYISWHCSVTSLRCDISLPEEKFSLYMTASYCEPA